MHANRANSKLNQSATICHLMHCEGSRQWQIQLWHMSLCYWSKQQKGINFESSYTPTAKAPSNRTTLTYAASCHLIGLLYVVNCFQNTLVPYDKHLVIHVLPKFIQWSLNPQAESTLSKSFVDYRVTKILAKDDTSSFINI